MWNLMSKSALFVHPKIKNPGLNVVDIDFNEIVNFLNQEDFDIKKVNEFDRLLCSIMYNDISPFATVLNVDLESIHTGERTEPNSSTIIFNSSYNTYRYWFIEYLMALHVDMYSVDQINHKWYLSDEKKHMDDMQIQIMRGISYGKVVNELFPTDEKWNEFINQIFPNDVKNYCYSFTSIYDREVNYKNLNKVIKSGFPKKKKTLKALKKFITETFNLNTYLKYVLDNNLWPETKD